MKKIYNKDILLLISLAVISLLFLISPPLNMFPLRIIPCVLLLFILPGCSILAALYPFKERFTLKKYLSISVIISIAVASILSMISVYTAFKISYTLFIAILTAITVLMAIIAYKRRGNLDKLKSGRYLVCEKCNGYYKLREGESTKDFERCHCSGNLKHAESSVIKPEKVKNDLKAIGKTSRLKKINIKSPNFEYRDYFIVIIITFFSVVTVSIPSLNNSFIRMGFIAGMIFFLSGYSLSLIIFPLNRNISRFKRGLLSIVLSLMIIFIFSLSSLKTQHSLSIMIISIVTILLAMYSFLNRLRLSKDGVKEVLKVKSGNFVKYYSKKYLKRSLLQIDLLLVLLATFLCVIFVTISGLNENPVRMVIGLIFVLFMPGYSLIAALFPKRDDLSIIERIAFSFGLSIALSILIGLALNYTSFGIRLMPVLTSLSLITVLLIIFAYIRRIKTPNENRFNLDFNKLYRIIKESTKIESKTDKILSIFLILSIVFAFFTVVYTIVTPKQDEKFTEFYILGPNGKASDYPTNLTMGQTGTVNIGIVNHEYADVNYKLLVKLNNQTVKEENITLSSNGKWENKYIFSATRAGEKQKLEFLLFKLPDDKKSYRSLHLWINVN